jgi:hypothetical protein
MFEKLLVNKNCQIHTYMYTENFIGGSTLFPKLAGFQILTWVYSLLMVWSIAFPLLLLHMLPVCHYAPLDLPADWSPSRGKKILVVSFKAKTILGEECSGQAGLIAYGQIPQLVKHLTRYSGYLCLNPCLIIFSLPASLYNSLCLHTLHIYPNYHRTIPAVLLHISDSLSIEKGFVSIFYFFFFSFLFW